ncbi:amidase [Henriciella marina]|uniref:Amidase n=1 Tax=Henriciella marina TaxID=453851 RepID=A0ABT4LUD2_9PROT|nr:amidase [Henriciella marina]MCZ4297975.1 amidase [Henriciella marina]
MKELGHCDATELASMVRKKEASPSELLDLALESAQEAQGELNCFSSFFEDAARKQIKDGLPEGPFTGVPFAVKDLGARLKGQPITSGSRAFKDTIADMDAELVKRQREAGLVIFGQTTSPEFGLTTSTESALYGKTRNPWNTEHTSGGSSGGASACVAAGVIPMAHASDGGGSIRIPAACTGLVGLKPSRGRVPMGPPQSENSFGLSTNHCVARSVRDSATLLDVTHGQEPGARYVAPPPEGSFLSAVEREPDALKIAVWNTAPNGVKPDKDAQAGLDATVKLLGALGHHVEEAEPVLDGEALGKGMMIMVSSFMASVADERAAHFGRPVGEEDFEPVSLRFIELGRTIPMSELVKTNNAFMEAAWQMERFMDEGGYDLILAPTLSRAPVKLGVLSLDPPDFDQYGGDISSFAAWCPVFNQTGWPAISLPLHWTDDGLPLGMMFGARLGKEELLYSIAGQIERAQPWASRRPPVWVG